MNSSDSTFLAFCTNYKPAFDFFSTICWIVYVYFTIKTFKEIHKQTEIQSEAYLIVSASKVSELKSHRSIPEKATSLSSKWNTILSKSLPQSLRNEEFLALHLENRGRSDIVFWKIKVFCQIVSSESLQRDLNIHGEKIEWEVIYSNHQDLLLPFAKIEIPICSLGNFPVANISWTIEFKDVRDVSYSNFAGDSSFQDQNVLACKGNINKESL